MFMPVMNVWKMQMRVYQWVVPVQVAMHGTRRYRSIMLVLVVVVMNVFMIMRHLFVGMLVLMALGQM